MSQNMTYPDFNDKMLCFRAEKVSVVKVYAVNRGIEERVFNGNLGNKRLLFHASAIKNFVGILSR